MQLKATKLAAIFSRLHSAWRLPHAVLALALSIVSFVPFGVHAAGSLPAGYTRLDFIESTVEGEQYIEIPSEIYHYENVLSNEVKIVGEFTASSADKWQSPCGFSTEGWSNLALRPSNNQGAEANKFGNEAFKDYGGGLLPVTFNSRATIVWAFGGFANGGDQKQSLEVTFDNGATQRTAANQRLNDFYDLNKPLMLFAVRRNSDDSMLNFSNFRLYGLTVKLNGTLKADFVPALNPSGVPGLYDTVTGRFLTNQGSSQFIYPKPNQWVRFTITKKKLEGLTEAQLNSYVNRNYVQLDEFGLYSAEGIQQNLGLKFANDPSAIAPGYFYLNKVNASYPTNLFLAGTVKWCYSENGTLTALEAGGTDYLVFTMHLRDDAAPVVKYNLRSGNDTATCPGRAPVCWKVETSDNGIDWVVRDEQADEATSGYTTANNTWYGGGGNGDAPTTFYVLQPIEHPLPADYTRLEWIKSTRQQHILTDYYPNPKTWMQVDCMFTGRFEGDSGTYTYDDCTSKFCDANEGVAPYSIAFTGSGGYFNWLICWMAQSSLNPAAEESGAVVLKAVTLPQAGNEFAAVDESVCRNLLTISNGVSHSTLEWSTAKADHVEEIKRTIPRKTTTCTKRLALFGTAEKNFGTYDMTVWSWKIYESDSGSGVNDPTSHLVHNFIPAKDPDGVPGLWDTVTGEFRASDTDTPFEYKPADQWFRLKITQIGPNHGSLTFSEFALYDAEGVRQNLGLTEASSIDHIGPGQFFHDKRGGSTWGDSPTVDLFDGDLGQTSPVVLRSRMGMTLPDGNSDSTGKITDPQVIIMHLQSGANEVVKYSLASGDFDAILGSPRGWILERSYDGRNWTEIIRKTDTTSEYATGTCSWYRDGGGDAAPTTFYPAGNWGEGANQWFRLTIRKKHLGTDGYGLNSLQLDEFALFDAEGKRQDIGLEPNGVSAASLLPGEWYYEGRGDEAGNPTIFWVGQSPSKLFDRNLATKWGVDYERSNLSPLGDGDDETYWQVLTLRLLAGTSEVVSYNLCSGYDTGSYPSRAPTSWVLERSSDGINWVVFDEKTEADHQYTLESSTWYGNGGKDEDPTNVFWIVKLPLPKLGQTVYSYTGAPISPKMMEESEFYTLSGDTNATAVGTYKLVCTPISGLTWANGSTGPYELVWEIVPETFLQRVASDPKRVDGETVDYDTGYASGGDIVLKIGNEYVHVFTNGTDRTFTAKTELANARILVVGGGGSGGTGYNGYQGAGGGAGGLVEMVTGVSPADYRIDVGAGGSSANDLWHHAKGYNGANSAVTNKSTGEALAVAFGGGAGGSSGLSYQGSNFNCDLAIGLSGGSGGGHSAINKTSIGDYPSAGWYSPAPGVDGQGYAGGMAYTNTAQGCSGAGGGGAGGAGAACTTDAVGGVGGIGRVSDILGWSAFFAGGGAGAAGTGAYSSNGGAGGGGSSCSHTMLNGFKDDAERALIMNGSNGQGGGGAGALSKGEKDYGPPSGKGGDGIVIIRYQIPDTTLQATPPVAKTGLTYNGKTQVGVPEGVGYTLKEAYYYATAVGTYTTTATLLPGYVWEGGSTDAKTIEWSISMSPVVASAEDVVGYEGSPTQITVTVTLPSSGATVTYCTTSNGVYSSENPSFTEFGAHRVYWKATADGFQEASGSAVVRIGKKAAGQFVRLTVTKRKGGDSMPEGKGGGDFELGELALYDARGTRLNSGLALATEGLAQLKATSGTCYSFPTNWYGGQGADKLFNENKSSPVKLCCPRNSTSSDSADAHIQIYMHLSDENADKVICSYNLQSGDDVANSSWLGRSPTEWRLEVSSDCERWTIIDEKTVADTKDDPALNTNNTWYNGGVEHPYPIKLDYMPMEVLETNPYAEGDPRYSTVSNYVQIVGFQLEADDVVTAKVRYNATTHAGDGIWDTLFCQRDLDKNGNFSLHRQFADMPGAEPPENQQQLRFDYGDGKAYTGKGLVSGLCEFIVSASGVKTNGAEVIAAPTATWKSAPNNSLLLFASDNPSRCDGVPAHNPAYLQCYYFQVANSAAAGSPLRLDLMPASNTVTHAHGLYDRMSGSFYPLQKVAEAGQQPFTSATIASHYAKPMTVKMNDAGWDQLPILTEVDERLASVTNYLTSIPNYWQQEWVPGVVDHAGEYRQILRGQGPYAGEVTNVYAVGIEVALNANGGAAGATNSVLAVPGRPLPAITGMGALPTKSGCLFLGYWTEAEGGVKYYNADGTSAMEAYPVTDAPTTLYAHWLEGYESLAKLNFDGSHFILTDYVPNERSWFKTEMQVSGEYSDAGGNFFFGQMEEETGYTRAYGFQASLLYGLNGYWVASQGNCGIIRSINGPAVAAIWETRSVIKLCRDNIWLNDVAGTYFQDKTCDFTCTAPMAIGGANNALPNQGDAKDMKPGYGVPVRVFCNYTGGLDVYSFAVFESDNGIEGGAHETLVHNYIPVTNTIAKVAGLYDVINEVFYPLKTQTVVQLDPNGGNQATNYVYATAGEAMPSPIEIPTRQGYTFLGYAAMSEGDWSVQRLTGNDADVITTGNLKYAYAAKQNVTLNGVAFEERTHVGQTEFCPNITASRTVNTTNGQIGDDAIKAVASEDYLKMMGNCFKVAWGYQGDKSVLNDSISLTLKSLNPGTTYCVQVLAHIRDTYANCLGIKPDDYVVLGGGYPVGDLYKKVSQYGWSFSKCFVADDTTAEIKLYSYRFTDAYMPAFYFNAIQVREIGEDDLPLYYNAEGTSDKTYPTSGGPTTLYAQWELANYPITYEGLEGADNPDNPTGYTVNDELVLRAPGKRDGYVFGGWWENDVQISYIPTNTTGAKTLTANWVSTNDYQLIEYIATTNCQFLDTGVTPRNAHFGFALDFWDQCYVRWGETDSPYISPDESSNTAKIMGTATNHRGVGQFSGFCFGNWNRQSDRKGQLVLCCDYNASSESINPMLKSDSRLRVKMVNDYNPTGCTPTKDTSYSKYTVKGVSPDGTEASVAETYYRHHIASGIDVYQDMPEWFAGSVYVGAMNREDEYQNPYDLGYGKNGDKDRNNYMRFYRVTFYYDDIVLYDAIPAIDSNGHVGLLRVDGAEGELFAYSKTIQEDWTTAHPEDVGAEFATPFFKVNGNGGSPEETTIVKYVDQPALTVDQIPERDGFTLMGFTNATGRVYQLDGDNKFVDVPQDGETVYARWFASGDYELLPCLDNGSSLDTAGYVALTNFRLTGANVVELKYCVNAENDDKWQGVFWSRMPEKSYSLVLRNRNHSSGCKWQVTYGVEGATVSTYDRPIIGTDYVLRLCPTAVGDKGLLGYLDGNPVSWELYNASAMFEDEAQVDTLLFAAGRTDPLVNDEPSRDVAGKMTGPALAKMYYFRVENSATDPTLRLDLVPARKTATGVRGFYDLVNGNFYPLKTPVVLDGNGGEPSPQYVYTSKGEAMPALPNKPTRADYSFLGYYGGDGTKYYDENGAPVRACDFEESATSLSAHWLFTNTQARQELEEAFDAETTGTTVEPVIVDGAIASYTVVLARDYDQGVTLPGDLGPVTIDMNGWTIRGTNGVDGATTTVDGESLAGTDGGPAITVSDASGADAGVTAITVTEVWAEYMIIDLRLSGPESVSYEVAYSFDEATNRYNTFEYKTDKIVFRKIPHGTFTMGSPEDEVGRATGTNVDYWRNPETQHEVTLTQDYYIGLFPVTQRQWELVMGWNPSHYADDETRPVGSVTYQMIRGSGDGIDVSKLESGGLVGEDGFLAALRAKSGVDYLDLPSEAQWECAARAGTTTSTFFGDNVKNWSEEERKAKVYPYLWYDENSSGVSHGVGQVFPNPWGLYDTLGNVWEWCLDRVTCSPGDDWTEPVTDPLRKVDDGRVPARGGKTDNNLDYSRSASRDGNSVVNRGADSAMPNYGLRLAGICPADEDNGRPAAGTSSAVIGGNGGNGYPPGKGSPAVTDTTGAKVTVTDPLTLVSDGNDGERWAYDLHVIRDEAGVPTVVVPMAWLKDANPESEVSESAYQAEFLKTNASGVVEWQAYVLGFAADKWSDAAIVEETVQNADPKTVTIRLRDMSAEPRTNATTRLAYSLLSARTPAGFADGGGTVVTNLAGNAYYKWDESTFEAPLSDLSDENPVNYYRIKIHFIFGGGGEGEKVAFTYATPIDGTMMPVDGWTLGLTSSDDIAYNLAPINTEGFGYVSLKYDVKSKFDVCRFYVNFLQESGDAIVTSGVNANANDGFNEGEFVGLGGVYRIPDDCGKISLRWGDSNVARQKSIANENTDMLISNVEVKLMDYQKAAAVADDIFANHVNQTAWNAAIDGKIDSSAGAWTRNLSGLQTALTSGKEYKVLMMGDSTSCSVQNGCIEALIKRQWPNSNIKFYLMWKQNSGCYYFAGHGGRPEVREYALNFDYSPYDLIVFSGISQTRYSPNEVTAISDPQTTCYNVTNSVREVMEMIRSDSLGDRKNTHCEFVMMSPLLSVDSRKLGSPYDVADYATDAAIYWEKVGEACAVVTDWDVTNDPWAKRDYIPIRTGMPKFCEDANIAHWDLFPAAYDYLYRSGMYYHYYSRDAVHPNSFGYQVCARLFLEALKIVGGVTE